MQSTIRSGRLKRDAPNTRMRAVLRAFDPLTGNTAWERESHGGFWDRAGVMSTDGGLVFQGTGTGRFRAYDTDNGRLLLDIDVGTAIIAAPMTYLVNDEQYIAVMAGWGGAGWYNQAPNNAASVYGNEGRILAFRLNGGAVPKPTPLPPLPPIPKPPELRADAALLARGAQLHAAYCMFCHSDSERTGSADLRLMSPAAHATFDDIVLRGARLPLGMPRFDDALSTRDAGAIHQFLISRAWQAYDASTISDKGVAH
jgi:quinohemoprotein ethanol dehydrogenase